MITPITADRTDITADATYPTVDATYEYYLQVEQPNVSAGDSVILEITVSEESIVRVTYGDQVVIDNETVSSDGINEFIANEGDQNIIYQYESGVSGTGATAVRRRNYHNLYNNGAGVMRFKEGFNGWTSFDSFSPEGMTYMDNLLYSFKGGQIYSHNGTKGKFYGVDNKSVIAFRASDVKGVVKILKYMILESNVKPSFINVQAFNPYTQQTSLCPADMIYREGDYFMSFLYDMLSPNINGATEKDKWYNALIQGDELRSSYFDIYMEFGYNSDFKLTAVTIGTQDSTGHKTSK